MPDLLHWKSSNNTRWHSIQRKKHLAYTCSDCGATLSGPDELKHHRRTHTNKKPYVSEECDSTFRTSGTLTRHRRVAHRKEKPVSCTESGANSSHSSNLVVQTFKSLTQREGPVQRSQCGARFLSDKQSEQARLQEIFEPRNTLYSL